MAKAEQTKVVIYVSTAVKWLFLGFYDPLLRWAMTRVTNTIRVIVPDVDIVRYHESGAIVLVLDTYRAHTVGDAVSKMHSVTLIDAVQYVRL